MTDKEKAKRYDKAIEKARKLATDLPNGRNDRIYHIWDLESIFPELRESEDEKIRKELIEHVKDQQSSFISAPDCRDKYEEEENNKYNSWLVWLEKQGEQKPQRMVSAEAKEALYDKLDWGKEDESYLNTTIAYLKDAKEFKKTAENCIDWLKKLKQRIGDKL